MWRRRSAAPARPRSDTDGLTQGSRPDRLAETGLRDDVHGAPEEPLQPELQAGQVEERPPRLQGDEDVHVAVLALLATRDGAEDADVPRAALGGRAADLVAEF